MLQVIVLGIEHIVAYNNTTQYNSIAALKREDEGATPFVVLVVYSPQLLRSTLVQLYKTAVRVIGGSTGRDCAGVRFPTALYDKGEANDYIIIYYYVVHQSKYSIVVIAIGY